MTLYGQQLYSFLRYLVNFRGSSRTLRKNRCANFFYPGFRRSLLIGVILRAICFCLLSAVSSSAEESADSAKQEAIRLIQSGRSNDAAKLLLRVVARFQTDVNLWNLLG